MSKLEASIPCPKCGKSLSIPIAHMAPGSSYPCPSCGNVLTFAGQDASKIQEMVDALGSQFPGVSVAMKVRTKRPGRKFW